MQMELLRIPAERVAVLLGKNGATKRFIERKSRTRLNVDKEGAVQITGSPLDEWKVRDVIIAIGRGFNPEKALKLLGTDEYLKVVNLKELFGSEKQILRQKGRLIGKDGRTRKVIEQLTEVDMCVYGNTVALIGELEELSLAEAAIGKLLSGTCHSGVYKLLEKGRRKLVERKRELWIHEGE
jgi:ribosomal RNA assembly protein